MKNSKFPKSEILQRQKPYQSTIDFQNFLLENKVLSHIKKKKVLDVGTGIGSNLKYFGDQFKNSEFVGIDYNKKLIDHANKLNKNKRIGFYSANILKNNRLKVKLNNYDLLFSIHTICCFKNLKKPIKFLCDFKTKWIAINSLFYDGPIDAEIHMKNKTIKEDKHPDGDFNIFSIQTLKEELKKNKYKIKVDHPYFPKNPIKRVGKKRGSYTIKTEFNKNTVFSGPIFLPWHFVLAKRDS